MRKLLVLASAGICFLAIARTDAAETAGPVPPASAPPPATAEAPSQIAPTGTPIVLETGKGTLIKLDRPAATVFIANPDVADVQVKSPSLIYVNAKAPGETVLYAVDAGDQVLLNSPVRVDQDLSRLRQSFHSILPGENIDVKTVDNSVVLSGRVSTPARAEQARTLAAAIARENKNSSVINDLGVTTPNQVNVRVRIAEVDRQILKALGINWNKASGRFKFSLNNPTTSQDITVQNLVAYTFGPASQQFTAVLDALAQENLIKTLAEPNLTAISGQTASFLAGGTFYVPVGGSASNGVSTITTQPETFGVSLELTPTIIDANHVNLRIRTEDSQLSTTGQVSIPITSTASVTIPGLTVRRAETTVELGSGQSFALAGLLQNTAQTSVSKLPWLGDIPVLGQLFRSELFERNESELVIIVTPYLVAPTATALASPDEGYKARHDVEQIINAATYKQTLPAPGKGPVPTGGSGLIGPVGFQID